MVLGMSARITQRDIAREAGVDVSTVSLCLSGHPRIPARTRERVRAVAERLGYRPDPALSAIAASRWSRNRGDTGLVLAFVADVLPSAEAELGLYLEGVRQQAALLGYRVEAFSLKTYRGVGALHRVIAARGIRGIIVGQSRMALPEQLFTASPVPVVHCGYLRDVPGDVVRPDLRRALIDLVEDLHPRHPRLVGFLPVESGLSSDRVILGAALAAAKLLPRGRFRVQLVPADFTRRHGEQLMALKPDAVITINERQARQLESWIPALKCRLYPVHNLPPLEGKQGTDLRLTEVGRASVSLLEIKLRHQPLASEPYHQSLLVNPSLISPIR